MLNSFELIYYGLVGTGIFVFTGNDYKQILSAVQTARNMVKNVTQQSSGLLSSAVLSNDAVSESKDILLLRVAGNLGITTIGKTREQITEEINFKMKQLGVTPPV